jgi:hypothetical protein
MSSTDQDGSQRVTDSKPGVPKGISDRFLYWPAVLALSWTVASAVPPLLYVLSDMIFGFLLLCIGVVVAFCACIAALYRLYRQQWRRSLSILILPIVFIVVYLNERVLGRLDDDMVLLANLSRYAPAPKLDADKGPRLQVFPWRDLNDFALDLGYILLVYDESDEIALPASQRSKAWQARAAGTDLACKLSDADHAFGHYYFVQRAFDC